MTVTCCESLLTSVNNGAAVSGAVKWWADMNAPFPVRSQKNKVQQKWRRRGEMKVASRNFSPKTKGVKQKIPAQSLI